MNINSTAMQVMPLILVMAVFYLLLIRPQQKKIKAHKEMIAQISKGDNVVMSSGIIGIVHKVEDDIVTVEVSPDVKIKFRKDTILEIINSKLLKK